MPVSVFIHLCLHVYLHLRLRLCLYVYLQLYLFMCSPIEVYIYIYIYMVAPPPRSTLRAFGALQVHLEGLRASQKHCKYRTFPLFLYVAVLWTRLILATAKSWNLKPESGTWKQEESIGFSSNVFGTSSGNGNISFPGYSACSLLYLIDV